MSFLCSLREHKLYAAYNPVFTFFKPSSSVVRIESSVASLGRGYCFIVCNRAWLNGKYLRFLWRGQGSYSSPSVYRVLLYDGEYVRSSDIDFPSGSGLPTKGNGLLQTIAAPAGIFDWTTTDVLINTSGGTQDKCTIFFQLADAWADTSLYIDIDWVEINTGSGGAGKLYDEQFTDAVAMELTGTYGDYGYISIGEIPERYHVVLDGSYLTETPEINRAFVIGRDAYGNPVWGEAQDSTEIGLVGERLDFQQELAIPTTAQATSTAEAILSKMRLTTKRGVILIPPNCGQELFDTVELSDAGANQSAVKFRVVGIRFDYNPKQAKYEHRLILGAP